MKIVEGDVASEPRGVVFLLLREGKILMQLRDAGSRFPGSWCFPGGRCDNDEEYIQTVIREVREEFALDVREEDCTLLMKRLGDKNWVWMCNSPPTEPVLHEGEAMQWMNLADIEKIDLGFLQQDILPLLKEWFDERA